MICAPADPTFEEKDLEELAKATQTDPGDWGFTVSEGVEVRGSANAKAPVTEKLGLHFVRVMPDQVQPTAQNPEPLLKIVTPSGKIGYVASDAVAPLVAGNCMIIKPARQTSIIGAYLMEILVEAGVPAGALHYLPCSGADAGAQAVLTGGSEETRRTTHPIAIEQRHRGQPMMTGRLDEVFRIRRAAEKAEGTTGVKLDVHL